MIIIGYNSTEKQNFIKIKNISDIDATNVSNIVWFESRDDIEYSISKYCRDNEIQYSALCNSLKDALFYNNLMAKYIFSNDFELCKKMQKLADMYFFDSKIIYAINNFDEIEEIALDGIDGVIHAPILGI